MTRLMAVNEAAPEAFARLDRKPPSRRVTAGIGDHRLAAAFTFHTDTLPYLRIWHDFLPHAGVLGVERENGRCGADHAASSNSPV